MGGPNGEGVLLYVGGDASTVQGRRSNLTGRRCFSGAYGPYSRFTAEESLDIQALLDSGVFSDPLEKRLSPPEALARQLRWEERASEKWQYPFMSEALVSYDLLIDEVWTGHRREKRRWPVREAEAAVAATVEAAHYLASQRERLWPRCLVLACQGVDHAQYAECVTEVLKVSMAGDWIGLGGWCILGRNRSWMSQFFATLHRIVPLIAAAGISRVHIFGVMFPPALGPLLWLADRHGLQVSTDSSKAILDVVWKDHKKAGALAPTWEGNVRLWQERLAGLRQTKHYDAPPCPDLLRQGELFK